MPAKGSDKKANTNTVELAPCSWFISKQYENKNYLKNLRHFIIYALSRFIPKQHFRDCKSKRRNHTFRRTSRNPRNLF